MVNVPLLDLKRRYNLMKEEINNAIEKVLVSQRFILGEEVEHLEKEISKYCNTKYAVAVASGTDALLLSLINLGIGRGDFVITTPFTFFATAGAIHNAGAIPVFVDIKPDTYNIDPEKIKDLLEEKTFHAKRLNIEISKIKAIIPVHLYGQMADLEFIIDIANKYNLYVIEDACQAIGAEYKGKKAGSIGSMGCFSFFPTKNLGAYGDGGMVTTNDKGLMEKLRGLRVHGAENSYYHLSIGYNSRLDTIQAAILLAEFPYLDNWNKKRKENAEFYSDSLKDIEEIDCPQVARERKHIFHQYTIRVKNYKRDKLMSFLSQKSIGSKVYYPVPLHLQKCFSSLGYKKDDFPIGETAAQELLSLPVFPELTEEEIKYVCDSIKSFMD
jgi:dTDP-4-amino-4,6-dideoxygalactose transaminase